MPTYEPYEPPPPDHSPDHSPDHAPDHSPDHAPERPVGAEQDDPFDTRHRPDLHLDPPDPADPRWRSTNGYRPTSGLYANAYAGGTSSGTRSGATVAMTAIGVVVVLVVGLTLGSLAGGPDGPAQPDVGRFAQCAAEHDEDSSLFSDAEWCDLELNGGDGDGDLTDMGGGISDDGGFEIDDYFPEDPYGFPEDPSA